MLHDEINQSRDGLDTNRLIGPISILPLVIDINFPDRHDAAAPATVFGPLLSPLPSDFNTATVIYGNVLAQGLTITTLLTSKDRLASKPLSPPS